MVRLPAAQSEAGEDSTPGGAASVDAGTGWPRRPVFFNSLLLAVTLGGVTTDEQVDS